MVNNSTEFSDDIRCFPLMQPRKVATLGLVGQVVERKGHHIAVEALARIRQRFPALEFRLKIFGTGPESYINRVKALATSRGVASLVEWCGYRNNCDEIYPEIDFGLVPTIDPEPFGLVAIEPAVYGKPVIASATGGLQEIVKDGETGFLVRPSDPDALAERITQLITNPDLVRTLGARAHADYCGRFNEPTFLEQYCRIIDALIGR
jgi:glycosyltransferase involved in cell wall biosynthesis